MELHDNHQSSPSPAPSSHRETLLTLMLATLGAGAFVLLLILLTGVFFYVVLAVGALTALGFFHYLVWGYAMTQEVVQEQQRERALQIDQEKDMLSDKIRPRRF